jgi:hypothetical protein
MALSKLQLTQAFTGWKKIYTDIVTTDTKTGKDNDEIQKRMAKSLSSKAKRDAFCTFLELQFKIDKTVNGKLQTCINKPATQHYILKVPMDKPLTKQFSIRTANNELLKKKDASGKSIATQKQVDQKGVYHCFEYTKAPVKKPTQISKGQAWVTEFSITKEQFEAHAKSGKITFHVID